MAEREYDKVFDKMREERLARAGRLSTGDGITYDFLEEIFGGFCDPDKLIGIATTDFYTVFDKYCREHGYPLIAKRLVGGFLRDRYYISAAQVTVDGKTIRVYNKEGGDGIDEQVSQMLGGVVTREQLAFR